MACLLLLPFAIARADAPDARAPGASGAYSEAQVLLFNTPHLRNIAEESRLHYEVAQTGSLAQTLTDQIVLSITAINEHGGKDIKPQFLSGKNERKFPAVQGFRGNALLLYFLEWDIEKLQGNRTMNMHRIHRQYFQSMVRNAFSTRARVEDGIISFSGRQLKAKNIHLRPMSALKADPKYAHIWNKQYEFVLADVPGGIYRIVTRIPGDKPDDPPKEHMEITFSRVVPASAYHAGGGVR